MKKVIYLFVGLLTLMFVASCNNEDPVVVDPAADLVEVSFDINQFLPDTAAKDGDPVKPGVDITPCVDDAVPANVLLTLKDAAGAEVDYTLKLVTLNNGMETEVVKLIAGDYSISSFVVVDATGLALYASPMEGSYYEALWTLTGVDLPFTVAPFTKKKVNIDVLCYQPYSYEEFGFAWFEYAKYEVKTICFFGDICTKFFDDWHADNDGNPYSGQTYDGYDFAAIFSVIIRDANGNAVNDLAINSNAGYFGLGSPLCVEYPDLIGSDENYTFEIWLNMPDGSIELVHSADLAEGISSEEGNVDGFGGDDGIFDFVVGNCSYDGNDANLELPAWLPVPKSGQFKYVAAVDDGYVGVIFQNIVDGHPDTIESSLVPAPMWCSWKTDYIYGPWYDADFYSSLGDLSGLDAKYSGIDWTALNWLMNNKDGYTATEIQNAIWFITNGYGSGNQLSTDALANTGFMPTVGDWAIIILDAIEGDGVADVQLMIVRVDP